MTQGRGEQGFAARTVTYCLVPGDLAPKLHETLRRHFRDDPSVEVVVERRAGERRSGRQRRAGEGPRPKRERRHVRSAKGRRAGERRASVVPVGAPPLPRRAARYADRLAFVERLEPRGRHAEDLDTARVVMRFQAGDREAFNVLYMRYFDRVYTYLRVALRNIDDAEDVTQQVFARVFEGLPGYERRGRPFRAWLFTIARHHAISHLRKHDRFDVVDQLELARRRERPEERAPDPETLDWITDRDLLLFVERLPVPQRQVLLLRYLLGLSTAEVAEVLERTPADVRTLQHRALRFLGDRLAAIGRGPRSRDRSGMERWSKQAPVIRHRRWALLR